MTDREKIEKILSAYPPFVRGYFASIESRTSIKTRLGYAYDLRSFFQRYTSDLDALQAITEQDLYAYINAYSGEQNKARHLSSIRSFFAYLRRTRQIAENPAAEIETPKVHDKPITRLDQDEMSKVVSAAKYSKGLNDLQLRYAKETRLRDAAILTLFLTTGIRVSELHKLNMSDFDFKSNSFEVTRKGGNRERVYFGEETRTALLEYIESENKGKNDPLFMSLKNNRLSVRQIENVVSRWGGMVTDKPTSPHTLRRTYGTQLYEKTGDIALVATVLGHKSTDTTRKHYADVSEQRKRYAVDKVKLKGGD